MEDRTYTKVIIGATIVVSALSGVLFAFAVYPLLNPPQIINIPQPYPAVEYRTITQMEYVDRWHEPKIVTVNQTVEKVETKEVIVYRDHHVERFKDVNSFIEWYGAQDFGVILSVGGKKADCDDYAFLQVVRIANEQGYTGVYEALARNGLYYGKEVYKDKPGDDGHDGILLHTLGNKYYWVEPTFEKFRIIKICDRD